MWLSAFPEEFNGLIDADASRLVEVPRGASIVSGRWVNSWKTDGDGQVLKAKSRIIVREFSQSYGDDFLEAASPTVALTTTKITLRVAVEPGWSVKQYDVTKAFIRVDMDYDVYMRLPNGYDVLTGKVVLLNKAVYGLKTGGGSGT